MDSRENARTTARGRLLMMERLQAGWSLGQVAAGPAAVRKWRDRFAAAAREHPCLACCRIGGHLIKVFTRSEASEWDDVYSAESSSLRR